MSDLDFGLIQQNISNKKASFHYLHSIIKGALFLFEKWQVVIKFLYLLNKYNFKLI